LQDIKANEDWTKSGVKTAGFYSRNILWNKPTLQASVNDLNSKYKDIKFILKNLIYMIGLIYIIMDYCCFGKPTQKEKKLIHKIKEDVLALTQEELEHLRNYLLAPRDRYLNCC
jgi:hypothetical protein